MRGPRLAAGPQLIDLSSNLITWLRQARQARSMTAFAMYWTSTSGARRHSFCKLFQIRSFAPALAKLSLAAMPSARCPLFGDDGAENLDADGFGKGSQESVFARCG